MGRRIDYLLVCAIAGVSTVGAAATITLYQDQDMHMDYTLHLGEKMQTEELSFSLADIVPGSSASYTIKIQAEENKPYTLTVEFSGEGALLPFVDLATYCGGRQIHIAPLTDYIAGETISLPVDFTGGQSQEIELTYSMALDVGDEAQGAEADLRVLFIAREV